MGGKIPQPIRLEVIRKWLKGDSRYEIAKNVGIGTGTVSGIIQQSRGEDPDFDLLRGVALELRDRGVQVKDFAPLLRLKSLVEEKEVQLEIPQNDNLFTEFKKFEAMIVTLQVLCFKHGTPVNQFFKRVEELYLLYDKRGPSTKSFPDYLLKLEHDIENQKKELNRLRLETKKEVERQGATMNLLREYQVTKPLYEARKRELERVTKDRDSCREELDVVLSKYNRIALTEEGFGWHVGEESKNKKSVLRGDD